MTRSELISGVALVAALAAAGASAMRPQSKDDGGATSSAAIQPLEQRVFDLETKLASSERERKVAERQVAEAMSTALDGRRELDAVRAQLEDLMGVMGTGGARFAGHGAGIDGGDALALGAIGPDGRTVTAETIAALPSPAALSPYGRPLSAGPAPEEVATVRAALEKIKAEDDRKEQEQRDVRRKEQQERRLNQMAERLALTPEQTQQVGALWEDAQTRRRDMMDAMRTAGGAPGDRENMDRDAMRTQMEEMRKEEEARLNTILTSAQQAEYAKMQAEQNQRGRGGFGGGMGGGGTPGAGAATPGGGGNGGGGRGGRGNRGGGF